MFDFSVSAQKKGAYLPAPCNRGTEESNLYPTWRLLHNRKSTLEWGPKKGKHQRSGGVGGRSEVVGVAGGR